MDNKTMRYFVLFVAYFAVIYPLWTRFKALNWALDASLLSNLFPAFGLVAFALLWLHSISGVFEPYLRKNFNFDSYVHYTSLLILVLIILHPLFLLITFDFKWPNILLNYNAGYVILGFVGLLLLIIYDVGKFFKKNNFFSRNWSNILLISTIGSLLIFFHSLMLGSDLQSGILRIIWIFYGVTAILATIYTYGIKRYPSR